MVDPTCDHRLQSRWIFSWMKARFSVLIHSGPIPSKHWIKLIAHGLTARRFSGSLCARVHACMPWVTRSVEILATGQFKAIKSFAVDELSFQKHQPIKVFVTFFPFSFDRHYPDLTAASYPVPAVWSRVDEVSAIEAGFARCAHVNPRLVIRRQKSWCGRGGGQF